MSSNVFVTLHVCKVMRNQSYDVKRLFVLTSLNTKDKQLTQLDAASDWLLPHTTGLLQKCIIFTEKPLKG